MIRAIIFDFGQTLVDESKGFRLAEKEAQKRIFRHMGLSSWEDFLFRYRNNRSGFHSRSEFSRISIWRALYRQHEIPAPPPVLLKEWESDYWETIKREARPFPETERVLEELSSAYRLAVITNTQGEGVPGGHRIRQMPELVRFLEVIIIAGEGGVEPKPHADPFLRSLEKLDVSGSQAVYVGDDWKIDICGARAAGIRPIWIQHASAERSRPAVETSVPIITSLTSLLDLDDLIGPS